MGFNIGAVMGARDAMAERQRRPIVVHCGQCHHEWAVGFSPLPLSVMVALLKGQSKKCPLCKSKASPMMGWFPRTDHTGKTVWDWVYSGDTGISSLTIWSVLMGQVPPDPSVGDDDPATLGDTPGDPSDFARCSRLLAIDPTWRARLVEVSDRYPAWAPLVAEWDALEALYQEGAESGECPALYERLQALRDAWFAEWRLARPSRVAVAGGHLEGLAEAVQAAAPGISREEADKAIDEALSKVFPHGLVP